MEFTEKMQPEEERIYMQLIEKEKQRSQISNTETATNLKLRKVRPLLGWAEHPWSHSTEHSGLPLEALQTESSEASILRYLQFQELLFIISFSFSTWPSLNPHQTKKKKGQKKKWKDRHQQQQKVVVKNPVILDTHYSDI